MALGLGSLDTRVDAYSQLPQEELAKKVKLSSGLLDALAAAQVLEQKAAAAREMSLSQETDPKTIVQKNEESLKQKAQMELAEQVGGVLKTKRAKQNKNMQRMMNKGISAAPVQRRQVAAQGGIVGYAPGGPVRENSNSFMTPEYMDYLSKRNRNKTLEQIKKEKIAKLLQQSMPNQNIISPAISGIESALFPEMNPNISGNPSIVSEGDLNPDINPNAQVTTEGLKVPKSSSEILSGNLLPDRDTEIEVPKKGIPAAMPNMPNQNMIAPASVPKPPQDLSPDDTPETVQAKKESYDEWLQGLIAVLTAPASGRGLGGGNVGRAYLAHSQRVLDNKNELFELEIKQQTADAADEFNRIELDSKTYNQLSQRLLGVQKQIDAITSEVMSGQLGQQLSMLDQEVNNIENFKDGAPDPVKVRELEILEGTIAQAIKDRAQSYQYDNMGLFAQRKLYQDQLARMDDKRQFNLNKSPKLVP